MKNEESERNEEEKRKLKRMSVTEEEESFFSPRATGKKKNPDGIGVTLEAKPELEISTVQMRIHWAIFICWR